MALLHEEIFPTIPSGLWPIILSQDFSSPSLRGRCNLVESIVDSQYKFTVTNSKFDDVKRPRYLWTSRYNMILKLVKAGIVGNPVDRVGVLSTKEQVSSEGS